MTIIRGSKKACDRQEHWDGLDIRAGVGRHYGSLCGGKCLCEEEERMKCF